MQHLYKVFQIFSQSVSSSASQKVIMDGIYASYAVATPPPGNPCNLTIYPKAPGAPKASRTLARRFNPYYTSTPLKHSTETIASTIQYDNDALQYDNELHLLPPT